MKVLLVILGLTWGDVHGVQVVREIEMSTLPACEVAAQEVEKSNLRSKRASDRHPIVLAVCIQR